LTPITRLFSSFGFDSSHLLRFGERTILSRDISQVGVPFGLSHGDLSVGNLLVQNDVIYIVDWERAGEAPVFADLSKLFSQIPDLQRAIMPLFRQWSRSQKFESLEGNDDIILGKIIQLAYLSNRYETITATPEGNIAAPWLWRTLSARTKVLANDLSTHA
jgi:aminoglycoside phosphotransferase (APT) family kinase protein